MAYEQKDNSGSLFKNDKREKDTHPHAKGKAMIGGVMYWVSAWTRESNGKRWQSLAFTPMEQQPEGGGPTRSTAPADNPGVDDEDIPF